MSLKIIQKNIKWIATTATKVNMRIHETAVLIAEHAKEHGDCSTARDLVNAMPASMRRTMLVLWFHTYTPIRVQLTDGAATKVGMLKETAKGYTPFDLDAGRETPFFTLAEQNPEGKVLDFDAILKLVAGLGNRISKQIDEGKVKPEDVASATAAAAAITGLKLVRVDGKAVDNAPAADDAGDEVVGEPDLGLRAVA